LGAQASRSISVAKSIATIVGATEKRRYSLKAQAEDLAEARKALESAANIARGLWFTFMSLAAGVIITTGSVTHRDLFLETPVRLPLLNAELPMVAFFWVAPLMFLVFHGYLLLNLTFLGDNVRHYFDLVDDTGLDPTSKEKLYLQLPNFMVVQMLRERRQTLWTLMGYALHIVVTLTIIVGPLLALLFLQLKFLPYHSLDVTKVQRVVIGLDAAAIVYFWPGIVGSPGSILVGFYRALLFACVAVTVLFSAFVAAFPGEWNYGISPVKKSGITEYLFRGTFSEVTGGRLSWFSDTLALSDEDFVSLDLDKLKLADVTLSMRGRDLVEANLKRADLRKVDFTGANLTRAKLGSARLQGALFARPPREYIDKNFSVTSEAILRDANLDGACLNGAVLTQVDLRNATLNKARLDGAVLEGAKMQGASLANTTFVKANLRYVNLFGANIAEADLSHSDLEGATFTGAVVFRSNLSGANLNDAKLFAAAFIEDAMRGVSDVRTGWRTSLVRDLTDDPEAEVSKDANECALGAAVNPNRLAVQNGQAVEAAPTKADEIMEKGLHSLVASPDATELALWRTRADFLKKAICGDAEQGAIVLQRLAVLPGLAKNPLDQFGPFKRETAQDLLDPARCKYSGKIPDELKQQLQCWTLPDLAQEKACFISFSKKALEKPALK
jgi:uncharacterized protein YjbI with pentapeptide repeats